MVKPQLNDVPKYYRSYIEEVIDKNIIEYFSEQKDSVVKLFSSISEERSQYRYAESKWSIKEILGHLCDSERIFMTRALRFARNEKQELTGFDENEYVAASNFSELPIEILINDFVKMRESHLALFKTFNDVIWARKGTANKSEFTVSLILYIMAGHVDHHIKIIKERYL